MHYVRPSTARIAVACDSRIIAYARNPIPPTAPRAGQHDSRLASGCYRGAVRLRRQSCSRTQHAAQRWRIQASADGVKRSPSPEVLQTWRRAHVRPLPAERPSNSLSIHTCICFGSQLASARLSESVYCCVSRVCQAGSRKEFADGLARECHRPWLMCRANTSVLRRRSASTSTARARRRTRWTFSPSSWASAGARH